MRERAVARTASTELTVPPLTAQAASSSIDEMRLDVRDHDVPIGSEHRECCVDLNGAAMFTPPDLLCRFNRGLTNWGVRLGFRF